MLKCKFADWYKGVRPPKCGCEICELKWKLAEMEREVKHLKFALKMIGSKESRDELWDDGDF